MAKSHFPAEDIEAFKLHAEVILQGRLSMGKWVERFEAAAAQAHGCRFAVATNSCTAALEIALLSCGVRPGDRVVVPVQTFIATGMAVHNIGARPLFADIRSETLSLDPAELERLDEMKPKAVVVVHFGGMIAEDIAKEQSYCRTRGIALIEDAAHAHGAKFGERPAGTFGRAACFSYYPTKVLTAGEGGMLVTNDANVAQIARSYQFRGQDHDLPGEQFVRPFGRNVRMPELSALLGVLQYRRLDEFTKRRRAVAAIYDEVLAAEPSLRVAQPPIECLHNYWLYTVLLPSGIDRQRIKHELKDAFEIDTGWSYFPPLHQMPVFVGLYGHPRELPVAEDVTRRNLCLPVHPCISESDARCVANCFLHVFRKLLADSASL